MSNSLPNYGQLEDVVTLIQFVAVQMFNSAKIVRQGIEMRKKIDEGLCTEEDAAKAVAEVAASAIDDFAALPEEERLEWYDFARSVAVVAQKAPNVAQFQGAEVPSA